MEVLNETPTKKSKRLTSVVWNHFERVRKGDICDAVCVHCKKRLSGSSNSGTTHLRNHLLRCLKRSNYDVSQILTAKRKRKETGVTLANLTYDGGLRKDEIISVSPLAYRIDEEAKKDEISQSFSHGGARFNHERSKLDLARMIMLHGYPLAMVEHVGFKIFTKNLQPLFEVSANNAVEHNCMSIFRKEKQKVYELIRNLHSRIGLAVDMWFSSENSRYVCLTAHYVDVDWKLQKKILNFFTLYPSDTDDILSEVVIKCLTDWSIDRKLFSVTLDGCSTSDNDGCSASDNMVSRIKDWICQMKPLLKNGDFFYVRCATFVLKSIVQDVIGALPDVMNKIRASIRHVRRSQASLQKFNELAQQAGINIERHLLLDYPMQWDSTYSMLDAAVEYRDAFSVLQEHDSSYTTSLSETEWERVTAISGYMKLFVDVISVFVENKPQTANIYLPELCEVHVHLIEWCKSPDQILSSLSLKMKTKFYRYWSKCVGLMAVAAILDPRYKMKLVEYYYPQIYDIDAPERIEEILNDFRELYSEYAMNSSSHDQDSAFAHGCLPSTSTGCRVRLRGFEKFLNETSHGQSLTSDLDKYLAEPVFPRSRDFNILNWWKVHTPRYPILSLMARDVLGIPVGTLEKDLAFSNRDRVLDNHRSSLNPDAREALICGQDWLRMDIDDGKSMSNHPALMICAETS